MKKMKNFLLFICCIICSNTINAQTFGNQCKTIQISYNPNYQNLNCPIRFCITQELICENMGEESNCPIAYTAPFVSCVTLSPNHTSDSICFKVPLSSNICNCTLVTTKVTFERLNYDAHGVLYPIEIYSLPNSLIQEFMEYFETGNPSDRSIDFTKDCLGLENPDAGIRLTGTGNPSQPFIILVP
jgi:hypothetical protein